MICIIIIIVITIVLIIIIIIIIDQWSTNMFYNLLLQGQLSKARWMPHGAEISLATVYYWAPGLANRWAEKHCRCEGHERWKLLLRELECPLGCWTCLGGGGMGGRTYGWIIIWMDLIIAVMITWWLLWLVIRCAFASLNTALYC